MHFFFNFFQRGMNVKRGCLKTFETPSFLYYNHFAGCDMPKSEIFCIFCSDSLLFISTSILGSWDRYPRPTLDNVCTFASSKKVRHDTQNIDIINLVFYSGASLGTTVRHFGRVSPTCP